MSESPWLPWLYQYGVGGAVFVAGMVLALRSGAADRRDRSDRRVLAVLAAGFLGFLLLHALWIWKATRA